MFLGIILPIISLHAIGYYIFLATKSKDRTKFHFYDLPEIWLLGTASYLLPAVILQLLFSISLRTVSYLHFIVGMSCFVYFVLSLIQDFEQKQLTVSSRYFRNVKWYHYLYSFLSFSYILLQIILPLRGWDALSFYLPDAFYFYVSGKIPSGFNNITFFPLFKAPANSLLYTYSLFITTIVDVTITPVIYFIYSGILIIRYLEKQGIDEAISYTSASIYLVSPYVYIHILEFSYYQDPMLGFYFGLAILYLTQYNNEKSRTFLTSIAISMSILSKITGFVLFLLVILLKLASLRRRIWYNTSIFALFLFLTLKILSDRYIDYLFALVPIAIILIYLVKKPLTFNFRWLDLLKMLTLPIFVAGIWLLRLLTFKTVATQLYTQYFALGPMHPQWYYGITLHEIFLENTQAVSSYQIILILFLSYAFIPSLFIFKIIGFKKSSKNNKELLILFILFFSIWFIYHGDISIRYLQPIVIPFFVIIGNGISEFVGQNNKLSHSRVFLPLLIIQGPLYYYPVIPISLSFQEFQHRFFHFQESLVLMFIYIAVLTTLIVKSSFLMKMKTQRKIQKMLLLLIIIIPVIFQSSVLISNDFNLGVSRSEFVYDNRYTVTELSDFVKNSYLPDRDRGIGVNLPGVAFKSLIPIIDLQFTEKIENQSLILTDNSIKIYTSLVANNITFIITFTHAHAFYSEFINYANKYYFLNQPSGNRTELVFSNEEFLVWNIIIT